jgi:hypothetical protein
LADSEKTARNLASTGRSIVKKAMERLATEFGVKTDALVSIVLIAPLIIEETFAASEIAFICAKG